MKSLKKHGVILSKTDLRFEQAGVLNPAVYQDGNVVKMLYRAFRNGNHSTIGYCEFDGGKEVSFRSDHPVIIPEESYEVQGVEDPRVVRIDGKFYVTYTGYDGKNALGCLAISDDMKSFSKEGFVTPNIALQTYYIALDNNDKVAPIYKEQLRGLMERGLVDDTSFRLWDKDVILFPEKIDGDFFMLHRLMPGIQWYRFKDFSELTREYWIQYLFSLSDYILMNPQYDFETLHIGGGAPPVKTEAGWLMIYHGVEWRPKGRVYHALAALLDLKDPSKVIARLPYPLFSPDRGFEKTGYVNNVCFPTGTAQFGDELYIYYGAADNTIALATVNLDELVTNLLKHKL